MADRNELIRLGYRNRQASVPIRITSHYGKTDDIMGKINSKKNILDERLEKERQLKLKAEVSD